MPGIERASIGGIQKNSSGRATLRQGSKQGKKAVTSAATSEIDGPQDEDFFQSISNKEKRAMYVKGCVQMFTFFGFLAIFTVTVLSSQSGSQQRLGAHVKRHFSVGGFPLANVRSIDDYWEYVETTFLPAAFANNSQIDEAYAISPKLLPLDLNNRIVGSMRMWQVRVQRREGCAVGNLFSNFRTKCFMPLNDYTQDKEAYGPEIMFGGYVGPKYRYSEEEQGGQLHEGLLGNYPKTGHVEHLTPNETHSRIVIKDMQKHAWIGAATRAVFIDFTVWNQNLNLHCVTRIAGEFSDSGVVESRIRTIVVQPRHMDPMASTGLGDMLAIVGEFLLALFVLFYLAEEFTEFSISYRSYFLDPWNIMDWLNLGCLVAFIIFRVLVWLSAAGIELGAMELMEADHYTPMQAIAERLIMARTINAFNAVFIYAKVVKYIGFMPYIKTLLLTLCVCWKQYLSFLAMFLLIFMGFVIAYTIGFGETIREISTLGATSVYLARSFLGDIDLTGIYLEAPFFGAMLILFFMLGIYFLSINVFFAILLGALDEARSAPKTADFRQEMMAQSIAQAKQWVRDLFSLERKIRWIAPGLWASMYRKERLKRKQEEKQRLLKEKQEAEEKERKIAHNAGLFRDKARTPQADENKSSSSAELDAEDLDKRDILSAVENMAGKLLSKIQGLSFELTTEMRDLQSALAKVESYSRRLSGKLESLYNDQVDLLESQD
jgi:hypothetical protein